MRHWNARPRAPLHSTRTLYADQKTYLVELLMKQDQMSMAASIESRVPFLDHTLVEFAARIPDRLKICGREQKHILKAAVSDLLPRAHRPSQEDGVSHAPGTSGCAIRGPSRSTPVCVRRTGCWRHTSICARWMRSSSGIARGAKMPPIASGGCSTFSFGAICFCTGRREQVWTESRCSGMKILWVKSDFLHPTNGGGQIRTLETLKRLHQRHEIHYAALDLPQPGAGFDRTSEYCTKAYPVSHPVPRKSGPRYWAELAAGPWSDMPLPMRRYRSSALLRLVETLTRLEKFDAIVCDFLASAANVPELGNAVLFQHNVESMIWRRHTEHAPSPWHRAYSRGQYERMLRYEAEVCRAAKRIIAVSGADARAMRSLYGATGVYSVPTGVDMEYFAPPCLHGDAEAGPGVSRRHGLAAQHRRSELVCRRSASADSRHGGRIVRWP